MSLGELHQQFVGHFQAGRAEDARAGLLRLKLILAKENLLVPSAEKLQADAAGFGRALEIVEIAALLSLAERDIASFERHVAQAKTFYSLRSSASAQQDLILGLNLSRLLAYGKRAEFYIELESIPAAAKTGENIGHALFLEQCLNEGAYHKIFTAALPSQYEHFLDLLAGTMRQELASCLEKAYSTLPLQTAARMLHLESSTASDSLTESTQSALVVFAEGRGWSIDDDQITFTTNVLNDDQASVAAAIPSFKMLGRVFEYANELERIV